MAVICRATDDERAAVNEVNDSMFARRRCAYPLAADLARVHALDARAPDRSDEPSGTPEAAPPGRENALVGEIKPLVPLLDEFSQQTIDDCGLPAHRGKPGGWTPPSTGVDPLSDAGRRDPTEATR